MKLNKAAEERAEGLIESRQYVKESDWSAANPDAGLVAAKQRAAQQGYTDIEEAADRLLTLFPE